jgi:dihydrodipicolinate synthase/N-acetylneuraminate lyase
MAYQLHTVLARAPGSYPATVKDAMRILGRPGGYSRRPLRAMEGVDMRNFERDLRAIGLPPNIAAE